ncbi:MAG: hypothetical protein HYV95_04500 [Opitutae bacterium]|nr:hypothetical protein [Opitutae bacterium]
MNSPVSSIRPAVINHVLKGLLHFSLAAFLGFLAVQFGFLDERMQEQGVQLGFGAGFGAVALGFALAGCRNVHALLRPPSLALDPEGIRLRCWRGTGFAGFFLPYYLVREHGIPWADFGQTEAFTYRVNGVPLEQELRIQTPGGVVAFGWDVFSPNVARIQRHILDYVDELFRGPKRAEANLPDLQRQRWQQPLRLQFSVMPFWVAPLALAGAGLAGWGGPLAGLSDEWSGVIAIMCGLGALAAGSRWRRARGNRIVELRGDGLALGSSPDSLRVIAWTDIQFVRPQTFASTFGWGAAGTPALVGLEIRRVDGRYRTIEGLAAGELEKLHALLEPPLDAVIAARVQMASGTAPEAAAVAAGLAPR